MQETELKFNTTLIRQKFLNGFTANCLSFFSASLLIIILFPDVLYTGVSIKYMKNFQSWEYEL